MVPRPTVIQPTSNPPPKCNEPPTKGHRSAASDEDNDGQWRTIRDNDDAARGSGGGGRRRKGHARLAQVDSRRGSRAFPGSAAPLSLGNAERLDDVELWLQAPDQPAQLMGVVD